MSTFRKSVAAALAALTLGTAALPTAAEAKPIFKPWKHHHHHHGGWVPGAAIVGGLALAGALAASSSAYAEEAGPVRRCYLVDRVNRWGEVIGARRVCRYEY